MSDSKQTSRPFAVALRYVAVAAGCALLLLATICFAMACQVFIQTGLFAQSYAIVALIAAGVGILALKLARLRK